MQKILAGMLLTACLAGCPPREVPLPRLAEVKIVATCGEPGAACETDVSTTMVNKALRDFEVVDVVTRPGQDPIAVDDLLITFSSTEPVKGFFATENNEVFGETQEYETSLAEGSSSLAVSYAWKMKIALDNQGKYELNMTFFGAPQTKRAGFLERFGL